MRSPLPRHCECRLPSDFLSRSSSAAGSRHRHRDREQGHDAVAVSLAFQHGTPLDYLRRAMTRLDDGLRQVRWVCSSMRWRAMDKGKVIPMRRRLKGGTVSVLMRPGYHIVAHVTRQICLHGVEEIENYRRSRTSHSAAGRFSSGPNSKR